MQDEASQAVAVKEADIFEAIRAPTQKHALIKRRIGEGARPNCIDEVPAILYVLPTWYSTGIFTGTFFFFFFLNRFHCVVPNYRTQTGDTPLLASAKRNYEINVSVLVSLGANIDAKSRVRAYFACLIYLLPKIRFTIRNFR